MLSLPSGGENFGVEKIPRSDLSNKNTGDDTEREEKTQQIPGDEREEKTPEDVVSPTSHNEEQIEEIAALRKLYCTVKNKNKNI